MKQKIYTNGKWIETLECYNVINPYSGEVAGNVCSADETTLDDAFESAYRVFDVTKKLPVHTRTSALYYISSQLRNNKKEISEIITKESGKPIVDSEAEVERAAVVFFSAASLINDYRGEFISLDITPSSENYSAVTKRVPIGPVFGICPFNFPLNLVAHKVAPAIAAGNPIIIKPATQTPMSALKLAEIFESSGLPKEMLQVIPCKRENADKFINDGRTAMVSFTGSDAVGWKIKEQASKKKVTLELGGNAGLYIHNDANIDYAVKRAVTGSFSFSGQVCISVQRIYLHEDISKEFTEKFIFALEQLICGNPMDRNVRVGPVIDHKNYERIIKWLEEANAKGTKIYGGRQLDNNIITPAVLISPKEDCLICREEAFAPVVNLFTVKDFNEAFEKINDSRFGLQAGVFTNNINIIRKAFLEIEAGGIIINDIPTFRSDIMPYGGIKDSGTGREGIRYVFEEMTEYKTIVINSIEL